MKKLLLLFKSLLLAFVLFGCSDNPVNTEGVAHVNLVAALENPFVSINKTMRSDVIQSDDIDSLRITRFRMLISRVKFHLNKDNDNIDKDFNAGPFLFNADSTGFYISLAKGVIPAGVYDKIKFEFHRFSSDELATYENDSLFADFATKDRYNVIIEGIAYEEGEAEKFVFYGKPTANLSLKFYPSIDLQVNVENVITLLVNPLVIFKPGNRLIDPRNPKNANDIEKVIKDAIKAGKKI